MFEQHFGLRENPFAAGHQSRFVYPSREHQEAIAHLRFGIENREPFVLITGEVGTGKTTALYDVLAEYESRAVVALITNSSLTRDELLEEICLRFGLAAAGQLSKPQAIVALERFLRQTRASGHHAILILDEAQNLERDLLEEIRLLSNLEDQGQKLIQLFLVGQPELEEKIARSELRQLRQRITVFYRLNPLTPEDTERYIHHRITVAGGHAISVFPADACREVHAMTHGIPREINTVAGQAMLNAFVEDSSNVRPEHVRTVERDSEFRSVLRGGAGGTRISMVEQAPVHAASAHAQATGGASASGPPPLHPAETRATASAAPTPAPITPGPPALHPPETRAASPAAGTPEQTPAQASAPAPIASGPPPLQSAETYNAPPRNAAPAPSAPEPPRASPAPPSPAAGTPPASSTPAGPGQSPPRRAGAVAPAGTAEAWGTWLSSLAQIPGQIDETLADALGTTPGKTAESEAPSSAPVAGSSAAAYAEPPARAEVAPSASAPPRAEPAHTDPAPHAETVKPSFEPPRAEPVARTEPASRAEASAPFPWVRTEPAPPAESSVSPIEKLRMEVAARSEPGAVPAVSAREESVAQADAVTGHRTPRRLEFMEEEPVEEGAKTLRWLVFAGVVAVVAVGAVLGIRAWLGAAKSAQSVPAAVESPATTEAPATTSPATTSQEPGASSVAAGSTAIPAPTTTSTTKTPVPRSPPPTTTMPSPSASSAATVPTSKPAGTTASGATKTNAGTNGAAAGGVAAGGVVASGTSGVSAGGAAAGGAAAGGAAVSGASAGGAAAGGAAASGASSGAAAAGAAPAKSSTSSQGPYGIAVATYLDEERANEEVRKLASSTSLPGSVLTVTENDVSMYRVVLGSFESRRQADSVASSLIERGLVDEARVVPLSTATASKP